MAQEIENPIASPRMGGYKVGDEVTMYGKTMQVTNLKPDGSPVLRLKPGEPTANASTAPSPVATALPKASRSSGSLLEKIYANSDKFRELPEGTRNKVLGKLFDKAIGTHLPKAIDDAQREEIKFRFMQNALGISRQPIPEEGISEANYKKSGLPTGMGGKFQAGWNQGLASLSSLFDKVNPPDFESNPNSPGYKPGQKPNTSTQDLQEKAQILQQSTSAYGERHPIKSKVAEITGQALPGIPPSMAMTAGIPIPAGATLPAKIGINAARGAASGAVENLTFDPTLKGAGVGAALGGAGSVPFTVGGSVMSRLLGKGGKAATKVAADGMEALPGSSSKQSGELEALSQAKYQKPLAQLTAEQRMETVKDWLGATQKATQTARTEAKKAAEATKVSSRVQKVADKTKTQLEIQRAMDSEKALQKEIRAFVKANKRAPNEEELGKMRATTTATPSPAAAPTEVAPSATVTTAKNQIPSGMEPKPEAIADFRKIFLIPELNKQLAEAATPEEKAIIQRQLEFAHMPLPEGFKRESPEVAKAVEAVAQPIPSVVRVPEGVTGTGGGVEVSTIERKAKEALRKANARQAGLEAHKAEITADAVSSTPETALLDKEEHFLQQIERIEATGQKGKEAAKTLNQFVRKGTLTMDQALEMIDKVLAELEAKKGTP